MGGFDGDVRPDVAIGRSAAASDTLRIVLSKAAGFRPQSAIPITGASQPSALAVSNFDGDRRLDRAGASRGSSNIAILKGDGAGALTLLGALTAAGTGPEATAVGDPDLDGFLDVVVPRSTSGDLRCLLGKGSGTLRRAGAERPGHRLGPSTVATADLNTDGRPDLAVTRFNTGGLDVLLGTGQ